MPALTIDRFDIKEHVRWAQDQENLDVSLIAEAKLVATHPEIMGTSCIYPSHCEELFELQKRNTAWALFQPPPGFRLFGKRFFSYRLFEGPHFREDFDSNGEGEEREHHDHYAVIVEKILETSQSKKESPALFERDKTVLLHMFESIRWIEKLLRLLYGRKLQYQKG